MKGLTLIVGSVENIIYTVITKDEQILCAQEWFVKTKGTELLTPIIQDILTKLQHTPHDISRIACITGPGAFTGIRLVLTTAAAMRRTLSIPLAPLNYLQVLAANVPLMTDYIIRVVIYARQNFLYTQDFFYDQKTHIPFAINTPQTIPLYKACSIEKPTLFIGSGITQYNNFFTEQALSNPKIVLPKNTIHISSHALFQITKSLPETAWVYDDLEPLYLRECAAVENLPITTKFQKDTCAHLSELNNLLTTKML